MITPKVRILQRHLIDDTKWNLAIRHATNSLPYAYTWYLDALCSRWMGVVIGDYEFIMPLPIGRKWGLLYVYQPLFCQQLGVFYKRRDEHIIELMLNTVFRKFVYVNLNVNYHNLVKNPMKGLGKRKNLVLQLSGKHIEIQKNYSDNTLRNIKKGQKAGLKFEEADTNAFGDFTSFYIANTATKDMKFKLLHIKALTRLVHQFVMQSCGKLYLAKTTAGVLCAGVMVIESAHRIIHLLPAADDYARQNGAMQFLVDAVLCHYAGSGKIYDFEGSSVESIARFYESFGAVTEPFFVLSKSPFRATSLGQGA